MEDGLDWRIGCLTEHHDAVEKCNHGSAGSRILCYAATLTTGNNHCCRCSCNNYCCCCCCCHSNCNRNNRSTNAFRAAVWGLENARWEIKCKSNKSENDIFKL